jgi:FkbM family methyltransferase
MWSFTLRSLKLDIRLYYFAKNVLRAMNGIYIPHNSERKLAYNIIKGLRKININKFIDNLDGKSKEEFLEFIYLLHKIAHRNFIYIDEYIRDIKEIKKAIEISIAKKQKYCLKKGIFPEAFYYYHGAIFLPKEIINYYKNSTLIDGGAYHGESALALNEFFSPKKIYCFEPDIENYKELCKIVKINKLKNCEPINIALYENKWKLPFISFGGGSRITTSEGNYIVETISIDMFVKEKNILDIGIIKLDVEGVAHKVIKGGLKTIKKHNPLLLIGVYHSKDELIYTKKYLEKIGYSILYRKLFSPYSPIFEFYLIGYPKYLNKK